MQSHRDVRQTLAPRLLAGRGTEPGLRRGIGDDVATFGGADYGKEGTGDPYSFHPSAVNAVMGDGSVRTISESVSIRVFAAMVTRAGNEGGVTDDQ